MIKELSKHKKVDISQYKQYLIKATEFYHSMLTAYQNKEWNVVGLSGVHCAISALDALLVNKAGLRSKSTSHGESAKFLIKHINDKDAKKQAERFKRIINRKNVVEYESRLLTEKDATTILDQVENFITGF